MDLDCYICSVLDEYINNNYSNLEKMAKTITKGAYPDWQEILQECVLYIYQSDRAKIEGLIKKKQLRYWAARIMMNQYNSITSKYHYTHRKYHEKVKNLTEEIKEWQTPETKEPKEINLLLLESSINDLPFFERYITAIYYKEGHSLNSLSEATGISRTTIYKAIRKSRNDIKEKIYRKKENTK